MSLPFEILPTDTAFSDSPDAGPACLCSRCGKPIEEPHIPIRVWETSSDPARWPGEWRYHPACLGLRTAPLEESEERVMP